MKKIFVIAAIMCSLLLFACNKKSENESMDDTTEYSTSTTETETQMTETQMTETQMTETQMTETQMTETLGESSSEGKLKANFDVPEEIKNFIANAYNEEVVENSSFSNNALLYDVKKNIENYLYSYCIYKEDEESTSSESGENGYEITYYIRRFNDYFKLKRFSSPKRESSNILCLHIDGRKYIKSDTDDRIIGNIDNVGIYSERDYLSFVAELDYSESDMVIIGGKQYLREKWMPYFNDITLKCAYFYFDDGKLIACKTVSQNKSFVFYIETFLDKAVSNAFVKPKNVEWVGGDSTLAEDYEFFLWSYDNIRDLIKNNVNHFADEEVKAEINSNTHLLDKYINIIKSKNYMVEYHCTDSESGFLSLSSLYYVRRGNYYLKIISDWSEQGVGNAFYKMVLDDVVYSKIYYPIDINSEHQSEETVDDNDKLVDLLTKLTDYKFECSNEVVLDGREYIREVWYNESDDSKQKIYAYFEGDYLLSLKNDIIDSNGEESTFIYYSFYISEMSAEGLLTAPVYVN